MLALEASVAPRSKMYVPGAIQQRRPVAAQHGASVRIIHRDPVKLRLCGIPKSLALAVTGNPSTIDACRSTFGSTVRGRDGFRFFMESRRRATACRSARAPMRRIPTFHAACRDASRGMNKLCAWIDSPPGYAAICPFGRRVQAMRIHD